MRWILVSIFAFLFFLFFQRERITRFSPKEEKKMGVLPRKELSYLPSPEQRRALGDLLWMKVTLTYGREDFDSTAKREDWNYLLRLTSRVIELNPSFFVPYLFAGTVLPWEAHMVDEANKLLERGTRNLPWDWRIYYFLGFNEFYFLGENEKAALHIMRASRLLNSPPYLIGLATRLLAKSGRTETAINFIQNILGQVENKKIRKELTLRLDALKKLKRIEEAVQEYAKRYGRYPNSIDELIMGGILKKIPKDPYGGKFYIKEGKVWSTSSLRMSDGVF